MTSWYIPFLSRHGGYLIAALAYFYYNNYYQHNLSPSTLSESSLFFRLVLGTFCLSIPYYELCQLINTLFKYSLPEDRLQLPTLEVHRRDSITIDHNTYES